MIKKKSVAFFITNIYGKIVGGVSKNSETRMKNKLKGKILPGTVFETPLHRIESIKG